MEGSTGLLDTCRVVPRRRKLQAHNRVQLRRAKRPLPTTLMLPLAAVGRSFPKRPFRQVPASSAILHRMPILGDQAVTHGGITVHRAEPATGPQRTRRRQAPGRHLMRIAGVHLPILWRFFSARSTTASASGPSRPSSSTTYCFVPPLVSQIWKTSFHFTSPSPITAPGLPP
jgi:hypothetical protein